MKKIFSILLVVLVAFSMVACNFEQVQSMPDEFKPDGVMAEDDVYLTLVNKTHPLPDDWENKVEIITVYNSLGEEHRIEAETFVAFSELRDELLEKEDIQIELDSIYRSVAEQQEIWDEWSADPELGEDYCKQYLAVPGYSEHHTGLAVDIFVMKDGEQIRDNDDMIADVEDFSVIHEYLAKHGFILRYLEGKDDITGYAYEPWHLRYVGDTSIAKAIMDKNLTFEEYLGEQ